MEKPGFIVKFCDKTYESKVCEDLAKKLVSAISAISDDATLPKRVFGIDTMGARFLITCIEAFSVKLHFQLISFFKL